MNENDFRQLVDHAFRSLEWTDGQRLSTLDRMYKEERPIMKRKAITALVLILSIVVMSAAAVAVTVGIPGIQQLIDQHREGVPEDARQWYTPLSIDSAAVVVPENQRQTSRLVDVELHEAYITNEALYLTIHIAPVGENVVLWDDDAPPVIDGQPRTYFDLYREEDLVLIDFMGFSLHSPLNAHDFTITADYAETRRDPDGTGVTYLMVYPIPVDVVAPLRNSTVMGKFVIRDCHSRKDEFNVLLFDLPRMTIIESTDDFLHN